ncbi:MAG: outer membrane beta-barrel protein [Geobacter sp.]|nr:outer membrane beta-barrel protein [Geobacter sp.]
MKPLHKLMLISSALLLALPNISAAAAPHAGPYVSGFIGVSVPRDSTVTTDYFNNSPSTVDKVEFDPGINIGGTGGYDFGYVRLEGEISYRNSEIKSITDQSVNYRFRNPDGNLGVAAFMANAFFDLHNETRVTPYFGGGIGFAAIHMSDTYGTDNSGRLRLYDEGDDTVFAYQAGAGVEIAINRRFSLDVGYRYFGTDTASLNKDSLQWSSLKYESHNGTVGFRVTF